MKHHHPCGVKWRGRKSGGSFPEIRNRETALKAKQEVLQALLSGSGNFSSNHHKIFQEAFFCTLQNTHYTVNTLPLWCC